MPRLSKIGAAALAAFGWTSGSSVTASYLVVAGGGGASGSGAGGGGAGGFRTGTTSLNPTLSYTVTVGAGGAGAAPPFSSDPVNGSDSVFSTITSTGGGKGGRRATGSTGGSGGGGGALNTTFYNGGAGNTPSTSPSQGNNGGNAGGTNYVTGGGGGAGAVGANGVTGQSGAGGAGTTSSITGSSVTYAGGGGGGGVAAFLGTAANGGAGGAGGGGTGGTSDGQAGTAGTANTGGGGGGGVAHNTDGAGGSGGSGVVIISYPGAQQFGGGVVTTDGTNTIHTFTTSGTLSPLSSLTAQYLVVAGGGGGNGAVNDYTLAGGGGAGGLLSGTGVTIDTNSNYVVTVGAGGTGLTYLQAGSVGNGGNSSWSMVSTTAIGGGGGASFATQAGNGGSGGGAGATYPTGGTGTSGQGNNGGTATNFAGKGAGGGGGASAVGGNATTNTGGAGGAGTASSISGSSVTYAGGGGGAGASTGGAGGAGGGGAGVAYNNDGVAGTAFTGGGGGGAARNNSAGQQTGGNGGSGVVIIAYPGSTQQMAGGTVTISGGNVIHTFTSSGYLTPIKYASRSLRLRSSASAYLNRTPASASNRKTFTFSAWLKRGQLGSSEYSIFTGYTDANNRWLVRFESDTFRIFWNVAGTSNELITSAIFRDPSAWYHFVVVVDTTQATNTNRIKVYVNGIEQTLTGTYIPQNTDTQWNNNVVQQIGRKDTGGGFFDGYLTEINSVDGAALTPSSFGTFNSYGVWQPITYGGSYGTNGFYLTFGNNTSTTTLGYDTSPQGNNWTTNNISLTAGVTYDSMLDVPTLTSATVANYCTLNPLGGTVGTISNGNLQLTGTTAGNSQRTGSLAVSSGKWYYEVVLSVLPTSMDPLIGFSEVSNTSLYSQYPGQASTSYSIYTISSNTFLQKVNNSSFTNTTTAPAVQGDVISVALDLDNGKIWFGKNGTFIDSGNPAAGTNAQFTGITAGTYAPGFRGTGGVSNATLDVNFGQRPFSYTPPSGFVALNTYNLSTPTIPNGAVYMAATLYTGNNSTQSIANTVNGTSFQPDWVWSKCRNVARSHRLSDSVRGSNVDLYSDSTAAEASNGSITAFTSTGFDITNATASQYNISGETYVSWMWKANGTGVSNTSGSITSTVSANTTAGFSIVLWTGNGLTAATVGHGLGVVPAMIICKERTGTDYWHVKHQSTASNTNLYLNVTNASTSAASVGDGILADLSSSTTFGFATAGSPGNVVAVNENGVTNVAYCFAAVAGYSAFGSYTGNGSTDGPFVFLGFRPRFIFIKSSSRVEDWHIMDTSRSTYNKIDADLYPNTAGTEGANNGTDILSNGFKLRSTDSGTNFSGATYIYMAFAENPFKYSNAR